jgi:hypothetical protein
VKTLARFATLDMPAAPVLASGVTALAWSRDGRALAAGQQTGAVRVWRVGP